MEFFKLADDKKPSEHVNKLMAGVSQATRGMGPAEMAGLGTIPLSPLIRRLVNRSEGFKNVPQTAEELNAFVDRLAEGQKINPDIGLRITERPGQATYARTYPWEKIQREQIALAPKSNPLTIAHELGHSIQPNRLEKNLNIISGLARTPQAMILPTLLALSGGLSKKEETPTYAKAAPILGGAQLASILGEETRANVRALRLLKEKGIPLTALQKLRQFVPSLSYLGRGALLVGAPLGVLKGFELYEKSRKTNYPHTFKQLAKLSPEALNKVPTPEDIKNKHNF